jgi:hypothetical protein
MQILLRACIVIAGCGALLSSHAQVNRGEAVSSDDISVAEGLQLPTYGHVWALDSWKGFHELLQLKAPDLLAEQSANPFKFHHAIEFKGEASTIRIHDAAVLFFVRGVSGGGGDGTGLVAVPLVTQGQRREASKEVMAELKQQSKPDGAISRDILRFKQERIGSTDWYRLTPIGALSPGEYALVPLPSTPGFVEGEIFDFAFDPQAPENRNPLRSEQYRDAQ